MPIPEDEFKELKESAVGDARGRITLGPLAAKQTYRVHIGPDGNVLLTPIAILSVPVDEAWLFANKTAHQSVQQGLDDAAHGRVTDLGSFAQYADLEVDE